MEIFLEICRIGNRKCDFFPICDFNGKSSPSKDLYFWFLNYNSCAL